VSFSGRWQIFRQLPRVAVLVQAMHDIIGGGNNCQQVAATTRTLGALELHLAQ
jgi:hypothetical protein